MSLLSKLRAVVAGDDYLDGDYDELDYDAGDEFEDSEKNFRGSNNGLSTVSQPNPFQTRNTFNPSNVIGMPGIATGNSEVNLMEPRSFDEMPTVIQALRERKTVILNLTMMDPDQAQRAVDFVAGGTFAIDGHQERVGESIFLFAPSCVSVTNSSHDEASPSQGVSSSSIETLKDEPVVAPEPAWGESVRAI